MFMPQRQLDKTSPRARRARMRMQTVLMLMLGIAVGGCQPKKVQQTKNPPVVEAQPLDAKSAQLLVSDASQYIVTELPLVPDVANTDYRLVLGIGPIEVQNFSDPERFRTTMHLLRTELLKNRTMQRYFRMVTMNTRSAEELTRRMGGGHSDDLGNPDGDDSGPAKYDPRDIYILSGEFTQFGDRGGYRSLKLTVHVEHPHSRQVVLSYAFTRNFRWDGQSGTWQEVH